MKPRLFSMLALALPRLFSMLALALTGQREAGGVDVPEAFHLDPTSNHGNRRWGRSMHRGTFEKRMQRRRCKNAMAAESRRRNRHA